MSEGWYDPDQWEEPSPRWLNFDRHSFDVSNRADVLIVFDAHDVGELYLHTAMTRRQRFAARVRRALGR